MNVKSKSIVLFLISCLRCKPYLYIVTALTLIMPIHCIAESNSTPLQPTTTASPASQTNNSPDQLKSQPTILTNIKALIQKQQLDQAKSLAIDYLKSNPNDVDVTLLLGIIYYQQAAYQQAEQTFQQVLQKAPNYLDAKIGLVRVMIVEKKYKEASNLINGLEKASPNNPDVQQIQVFYQKATSVQTPPPPQKNVTPQPDALAKMRQLMKEGKLDEAKSLATEHLKQYPNDYDVMFFLGLVEYQQVNYNTSEQLFRQILKNSPTYLDAKIELARVMLVEKKYKEVSYLINELDKVAPNNPDVQQIQVSYQKATSVQAPPLPQKNVTPQPDALAKMKLLMKEKKLDEAKSLATEHLKQYPNDYDVMLYLGLVEYQQANYNKSEQLFRQILKNSPAYLDAKIGLARVMIVEKKYQEAYDLIHELEKAAPNNPDVQQTQVSYQKATAPLPQKNVTPQPDVLAKMKLLMKEKKLDEAKSLATEHLKQYPNDYDVMLYFGLVEYQQANYNKSEQLFRQILKNTPGYVDAKLGLIRIKLVQKKYKEASILIKEAKKQAPKNPDLKAIEISYKKAIESEKQIAAEKAKEKPNAIDVELSKNVNRALRMINASLKTHPRDKRLLTQKANAYIKLHLYAQSAHYAQKAIAIDPTYAPAKEVLSTINEISPNKLFGLNEIGLSSLNEYVADLRQTWDYSTLHLTRETWLGIFNGRLNYDRREGFANYQGEFEFVPIINPYLNFDLYYAFANQPALFPKDAYSAEGYGTIPDLFTLSLGGYYAHILGPIGYKKVTGSVSKDIGSNWLSFRVNHYVPNRGQRSTLYLGTIRHYFKTIDFYIGLTAGYGKSPDLADLLTSNFIVIRNKFINGSLRIPLFRHQVFLDLGADHQNWKYPSGLVRRLTGGTIGLSYRF